MAVLPTEKDLMRLPHRAIVSYAARAARRVNPRYGHWLSESSLDGNGHVEALKTALELAEQFAGGAELLAEQFEAPIEATVSATQFAKGKPVGYGSSMAIHAANAVAYACRAASAAARYANPAPNETFPAPDTVAIMAAHAAVEATQAEVPPEVAQGDYRKLNEGQFGKYPDLGAAIDCTDGGPLGKLWHDDPPEWYSSEHISTT